MARTTGKEIRAAFTHAGSIWTNPETCGPNDGVLISGMSVKKTTENYVDDDLQNPFSTDMKPFAINVAGSVEAHMRYEGLDTLIAHAMGVTSGAPTASGSAWIQTFTLKNDMDGIYGTLAIQNNSNVDEYPTCKITGMTLSGENGQPVMASFEMIASDHRVAPTVNTSAALAGVTYRTTANKVYFDQGIIRLNDAGSAALDTADKICLRSFELNFTRPMEGAFGTCTGNNLTDEPSPSGMPECNLTIEFPRYSTNSYFQVWSAETVKKIDMTFTGAAIGNATYKLFIEIPYAKIANIDAAFGDGIIPQSIEFTCLAPVADSTGMTGLTKPFRLQLTNTNTFDVIA